MSKLTSYEIELIITSLQYTKRNFESIPIGLEGYPTYEFKRGKITEVENLIEKLRKQNTGS